MTKLVTDGPLDEALYAAAPVKVLHLLKQVNSTEANWSLSQLVSEQVIDQQSRQVRAGFPVWLNLARWSHLLQQGGAPQFQDVGDSGPDLATALESSAVVNLMSALGGATTDPRALLDAARRDQPGWSRQIQELRPSYVVCGGTFWVLKELKALPGEVLTGRAGMRYSWSGTEPVYLDFVHPASRTSHAMMYAWLREAFLGLPAAVAGCE